MIDVLHQTDIFLPPADPDDHYDLAVQFALARLGGTRLATVLIDHPPATHDGAPAVNSLAQLGMLTGIWPGVSVGSPAPLAAIADRSDGSMSRGATIVLESLEQADNGLDIHIVGSCRDVAEAAQANPGLFETRCRRLYLNAGSTVRRDDVPLEYNVAVDPLAYRRIFETPCEIFWAPCFEVVGERVVAEYATHWAFDEPALLAELAPSVRNYLLYALSGGSSANWLAALDQPAEKPAMLAQRRSMWSVAGFFHSAGLAVDAGGAFGPEDTIKSVFEFVPVTVDVDDDGKLDWSPAETSTGVNLFRVCDTSAYENAMRIAMRDLLRTLVASG